jgi:RIP metalloprotease RseP
MIVGVLLMVIIHEAGHFVAAKAFDMKATEAFFGFGPKLWSIRRGETEYGIKAIPLGGYVRIIGMNPFEEVDPDEEHRTYRQKPFWQKSIVVLAGIGSHFVIAFLIFYGLAVGYGSQEPSTEIAVVSTALVIPDEAAGAQPIDLAFDDTVVSVDGVPFAEVDASSIPAGAAAEVVVVRADGERDTVTTTDTVLPTPSTLMGLMEGDVLVAVDGESFASWEGFVELTHSRPGQEAEIAVIRNGEEMTFTGVLASRPSEEGTIGFLGVAPAFESTSIGPVAAIGVAASDMSLAVQQSVQGLVSLVVNFGDLLGATVNSDSEALDEVRPISAIGLTRVASNVEIALALLALVNVFVGVLNVVPLYPLDGGHFAVALYERIRGRSADVRKLLPVAAAVFAFIVVLGVLGFYFDIVDPIELPG